VGAEVDLADRVLAGVGDVGVAAAVGLAADDHAVLLQVELEVLGIFVGQVVPGRTGVLPEAGGVTTAAEFGVADDGHPAGVVEAAFAPSTVAALTVSFEAVGSLFVFEGLLGVAGSDLTVLTGVAGVDPPEDPEPRVFTDNRCFGSLTSPQKKKEQEKQTARCDGWT